MSRLFLVVSSGLFLKFADVFTTYLALINPVGATEKNPIVKFLIDNLGLTSSLMLNFFYVMFMIAILAKGCMKRKRFFPLYFVWCVMAFVVINNTMMLYVYDVI